MMSDDGGVIASAGSAHTFQVYPGGSNTYFEASEMDLDPLSSTYLEYVSRGKVRQIDSNNNAIFGGNLGQKIDMSGDGDYIIMYDLLAGGGGSAKIAVWSWNASNQTYTLKGSPIALTSDRHDYGIERARISNDGNFVAVGQSDAEKVKSWDWDSSTSSWVARPDISEPANLDGKFGSGLDIFDNNTIAVGGGRHASETEYSNSNGYAADTNDKGYVVIFEYNGSSWSQKGSAILGPNTAGSEFGTSIRVTRTHTGW